MELAAFDDTGGGGVILAHPSGLEVRAAAMMEEFPVHLHCPLTRTLIVLIGGGVIFFLWLWQIG